MHKRLAALAATWRQSGLALTAPVAALERVQQEKEAHGEFESECPGCCRAQNAFCAGTLKGVDRIYQQTFVDTYHKSRLREAVHREDAADRDGSAPRSCAVVVRGARRCAAARAD